ncbi:competence protein ComK [Staphylococcus epidermidis]|uniref:competence protein ComK n=1 Tax=Staphylococcus epidermidis TaxID=1282 RepID=UPI0008E15003|nr:competence protein ComK [Staphylococcus epidermidis]MBC8788406.1 competence protein ComK [Staphylococcus epidermidis]MCO6244968.1 competence protein ComK [Staphylococcus epidermidis]MCO6254281.1 competence protein ComK [Staphylococcus epidermidis]MCO6268903.1 competence protein ComK [Staphylococcus epidermidis]MCO6271223.1 competence protein ComK [Staphylococcus epidermidis]
MTHLPETIYVIRKGDMVIRPKYDEYKQTNGTEIIRFDQTSKVSPFKVQRIIERSCKFYGNNYISKKAETNRITGISSKPPILLTPLFPTYFFPTHSDRQEENIWINMHYIENVKELKNRKSKIIFANGDSLTLNVSFHSLWHQYTNAIIYYYMVDKQSRMKSNNPEQPIDYNQSSLNIFEALSRYSLFEEN